MSIIKFRYRALLLFVLLIISSFNLIAQKTTREAYINRFKKTAIQEMQRTGIPASITLAQGVLESDNGNSTLAVKANNHFGIKCHKDWKGKRFRHDDDRPNECFRVYNSAWESFRDHSNFLTQHSRYASLFDLKTTDYKGWAKGLKKAGYATNKKYDALLIRIIEENKLYRFDDKKYKQEQDDLIVELAEDVDNYTINPFDNNIETYNRVNYVIVQEGDTFESISEKYQVMVWQLVKYNELSKQTKLHAGDRMYLQPKRKKAPKGNDYHTVAPDENIWLIAQNYGIKLKHLYKLNNMSFGTEPEIGFTLALRKRKKK